MISLGWRTWYYLALRRSQDRVSDFVWFSLNSWLQSWTALREAFGCDSLAFFICSFSFYYVFRCKLDMAMRGSRSTRSSVNSAIAAAGSPTASTTSASSLPLPASGNISMLSSSSISSSRSLFYYFFIFV